MASSAEKKQIDELIAKLRASAERDERRVDELEEQRAHLRDNIRSSMVVPAAAGATSFARAYYGDEATSIGGVSLGAAGGALLKALATLLDFSSNEEAQTAAKLLHDVANGALASWAASFGAELGAKKRMEKLLPAPRPNTGAEEMLKFGPGPLTHEDLAKIEEAMALKAKRAMVELPPAPPRVHALPPAPPPMPAQPMTKPVMAERPPAPLPRPHAPPPAPPPMPEQNKTTPAMPERPPAPPVPVHAPPPAPPPMAAQQRMSPPPTKEPAAAKVPAPAPVTQLVTPPQPPLNEQPAPATTSAKSEAAPTVTSTPHKPPRATKPWVFDPEAEMRALLQSHGAPSDPKTVAYVLMHKNTIEAYKEIIGRVGRRAGAGAPSTARKPSRPTKPWVLDPESEMRRLLKSHGAPSDPQTVAYVLFHENPMEAYRAIVGGAQVPTTKAVTPPQSPLNAPSPTKKATRRSLAAARTVGITEAAFAASPQMPPKPNPMELPKQAVRESNHSVHITQEELEAAERWRLAAAA